MKIAFLKTACLIVFIFALANQSFSQQKTTELVFLRPSSMNGAAVNFQIFVDGVLICKIPNRRFSFHQVSPGTHVITIASGGINIQRKGAPLSIEVKEGIPVYVQISTDKGLYGKEVSRSAAELLKQKLKPVVDCLPNSK